VSYNYFSCSVAALIGCGKLPSTLYRDQR